MFISNFTVISYIQCKSNPKYIILLIVMENKRGIFKMGLILMVGISVVFLSAILTAGYNRKPEGNK